MFPLHTWLPDAHTDADRRLRDSGRGDAEDGHLRLPSLQPADPPGGHARLRADDDPAVDHRHRLRGLVALAQKDWKRLVAYSSVSHMAMVMLGMFALNPVGLTGSIIQQLNHGISTGGLFLLVGVVYERRHTREISEYGGLSKVMPVYAAIFLVMTMSSIGLPTLNGFIGELLILQGVSSPTRCGGLRRQRRRPRRRLHAHLDQRTMFGKVENPKNERLLDLSHRGSRRSRRCWGSRLDGDLPGASGAARDLGAADHPAGQPAGTPPSTPSATPRRRRKRSPPPTTRRRGSCRTCRRRERQPPPVDDGRTGPALMPLEFRSPTSTTSCRSWCSPAARCSCWSPTCCCRRIAARRWPG